MTPGAGRVDAGRVGVRGVAAGVGTGVGVGGMSLSTGIVSSSMPCNSTSPRQIQAGSSSVQQISIQSPAPLRPMIFNCSPE